MYLLFLKDKSTLKQTNLHKPSRPRSTQLNLTWDHNSYMKEEHLVVVVVVIDAPPIPLTDLDPI